MSTRFSWLHLSDLHVGMKAHGWMWPNIKHQVYDDLRFLQKEHGKWDVVIFSGDLTQKGDATEFTSLTTTLQEMWSVFDEGDFQPKLFCVPGNHDLVRPNILDPVKLALDNWWNNQALRNNFWTKEAETLRSSVSKYFEHYETWKNNLKLAGIPILDSASGIMPGDSSATFTAGDLKIGLIGLNSAWLQLDGSDYKGKLHIDPTQLAEVTSGDATSWAKSQDMNLLITHHPLDWLHPESLNIFNREIDISGRFNAHLFGHMHSPSAYQHNHLGMQTKRSIQSASLFGLEKFGTDNEERRHGYSLNIVEVADDGKATLTLLPRAARDVAGEWRIGADFTLPIDNSNKIVQPFDLQLASSIGNVSAGGWEEEKLSSLSSQQFQVSDAGSTVNIEVIEKVLIEAPEALYVRAIQLDAACSALKKSRVLWLASEWGMGDQGFIWAIQKTMLHERSSSFAIDLNRYTDRNQFFELFKARYGFSFESMCESLSKLPDPYLIFEEIPFTSNSDESSKLYKELCELVEIILSYCPTLSIVLLSRQPPPAGNESVLEIKALDQADTRSFIENHRLGVKGLDVDDYLKIFQHTDGLPNLIENDLRNLRVASLSEVTSSNSEIPLPDGSLNRAMLDLSESKDPGMQRAYLLLKILCVFPQGEELLKVKNFDRTKPVFFDHAQILEQRGFIQGVEISQLESGSRANKPKRLIATRPVREWVQSRLLDKERKKLDEYAATSYFGASWIMGNFKPPHSLRFDKPGRVPAELDNARSIIQKIVIDSLENSRKKNIALKLVKYHGASLLVGDYYRGACELFQYIIPLFEGELLEDDKHYLNFLYAKALRMLDGESSTIIAKDMLLTALPHLKDKTTLISVYMNIALCSETLNESDDAVLYAKKVIALDKTSDSAFGAQQIIIEATAENETGLASALSKLEEKARKKGAKGVAITIALSRAYAIKDDEEKVARLRAIAKDAKDNGDSYDVMRAMVALGQVSLKDDTSFKLTTAEEYQMIRLYHYLYNEHLGTHFNKCHDILWKIFIERHNYQNLLQLFRYSSLLWRLRGDEELERKTIICLNKVLTEASFSADRLDIASSYFYARLSASIATSIKD
ncbi:metallophosphoesterase [Pseudomonas sp. sia0905]|uniref:metallophosphoesterase family protein n=1 Tax=Pseudomonas sp. sia0905 TaxID=2854783 RepID=UPI001C47EBEB|nr:metallophosphoesterase [Pseudomonas sp. sia0905]MBV7563848.1 metallophosphoesterase [Pseudomonas sp. sia0905]